MTHRFVLAPLHFILIIAFLFSACMPNNSPGPVPMPTVASLQAEPVADLGQRPSPTPVPTATPTPAPAHYPRVVGRLPGASSVTDLTPNIAFVFDQPMDMDSLAAAFHVTPEIDYELSWNQDRLEVDLDRSLSPGTNYKFTIDTTAKSVVGLSLRSKFNWTLYVQPVLKEITGPTFKDPEAKVTLEFNYPLMPGSLQKSIQFSPPLEGQWAWNAAHTTATFTVDDFYLPKTNYKVSFKEALVTVGGAVLSQPPTLSFKTPLAVAVITPAATYPRAVDSEIVIFFSQQMDHELAEAAFSITPALPGTLAWRGNYMVFTPARGYLEELGDYTITVAASAQSDQGRPVLTEDYLYSFKTGEMPEVASFGYGANIQVVDAAGRRALHYVVYDSQIKTLGFALHQLTPDQFLDRYITSLGDINDYEMTPIGLENAPLVTEWASEVTAQEDSWRSVNEVVLPADVPPGLYVLNMVYGHVNDQIFVLLTTHTVLVKQSENEMLAWVTHTNDGPAAGSSVSVYDQEGQLITQGTADAEGLYRTTFNENTHPMLVVAGSGSDLVATGLSSQWQTGSSSRSSIVPAARSLSAYIYTDRPIYKPGQTIYYKAIVRRDNEASPQIMPQGTPVIVRIRDARNNVVQTRQLLTNLFGTINGEFDVAAGAMLGDYAVEIELDGDIQRQIFKVQDYRKPDYEVKVTTDAAGYVNGGPIEVTVEAQYLYGEPVAKAQISLKQFRLERNYCWDFCIAAPTWYEFAQKDQAGTTDADGRYTFTVEAGGLSFNDYYYGWSDAASATIGLEVTVDDGSHQTVSSLASVKVYEVAEQVTLKTNGYLKAPGQPFDITLSALDVTGQPVVNRTLAVQVREWSFSSDAYLPTQPALSFTTGPDGTATQSLSLPNTGYYQLYLKSKDAYGHEFEMSRWLYVWDGAERWNGTSSDVKITTDRDTYAPGDTATLIIQSPISGPALLTFERASLLREQVVQLTAPITRITVPVLANDAPNIFVALNLWLPQDTTLEPLNYENYGGSRLSGADSLLRVASVELHVPVTTKTLNVSITPNKPTYAPREEATFTVRVTDYKGDPVSGEVSLALVDDAIFQLSNELSGPIFDAFYSERDNLVRTYNAMAPYRYLPCECGGGGGGGGGWPSAGNPRSNFPDTAAWVPVLTTNWNGEATVTFAMPDTLTRWRLTAKATTADTQVGETAITVTTYQPIIVRPLLPRTLTEGDVFDLSTVIYNYSDEAQRLIVILDAGDLLTTTDPLTRTLTLPAGVQIVVGWAATAAQAGEASLTFSAITPGSDSETSYGDSIRLPLTIQPLAIPNVTTSVGHFTDGFDMMLNLPEGASSLSSVRIELSRSIAGSLLNGLDYLTGFPYGCVEQTMSRALPNAVVGRAFYQLGLSSPSLQGELPAKVNASIQRLYGYQHDDGGWGWWYDDNTDAYQTAWVIYGLSMTAEAGYEVDSGVIKRGADWLDSHLTQMDKRTRAFALYSMAQAGYGNLGATKALAKHIDSLDSFSLAALALAFHKQGSTADAQQILALLETSAVIKDGQVHWVTGLNDGHYQQKTMASSTRSTALALSAFVAIHPGHALEAGIVSYLMSQRKQAGWGTTNETSFTLVALTDYLVAQQLETPDTRYTVTLNGQAFANGLLSKEEPNAVLELPASALHTGANSLRIIQEDGERLYYVVNQRVYISQSQVNAAGDVKVSRSYFDGKTNRPISGPVTAGQLVRVAVTVDMPDSAFYLLVVDNLPGGFEALNESLNTTSHVSLPNPYNLYETSFGRYGYNNKEIFADHVNFFITELSQSRRILSYFVRAVRAGTFVAMPAELTAMYDSTLWGRSSSARIVVVEK